ncbi:Prolipoprotein diacylglyceryl transferase [Planctomycetes bacterium Pla163]|uniref:Prolipoprotein diacylglyceryl transferase n=1 Tax=Rohdeia mirabilis TaxID=2528008 RepID=A0A518CZD1_9BACT|nr:Prolipoprotein diacylglyceryl transferase [Planctomycetes bacterium Pla163]
MHPVLFEIGGRTISSFGTLVALGFLVAAQWVWPRLLSVYGSDPRTDPARSASVALWVLVGLLLGGRLVFAAVEVARHLAGQSGPESLGAAFLASPLTALDPRGGGMVMYGGLFGGLVAGWFASRRSGLALARAFDTGLVAAFVGQSIGRVGCLMVGDDHGSKVPSALEWLPFPFTYRVPDAAWLDAHPKSLFVRELAGETVWATQTWMSLNALALAWIGARLLRRGARPGTTALVLLILYGASRFVIELFRGDAVRGLWFGGSLSTSQLVSIPLVLVALFLFVRRGR